MDTNLQDAFHALGAEVQLATQRDWWKQSFEIDVVMRAKRECFELRSPTGDTITAEPIDVRPKQRHLVLDVTGWRLPISGRYLCGHDERHWFVAEVPFSRQTQTVRGAMEALKPAAILREQRRHGLRRRLHRRKTAAYVRQGEWFFVPHPNLAVVADRVQMRGQLRRGQGKPHTAEWLYRTADGQQVYVRGRVQHADHQTIVFEDWHRVFQNTEAELVKPQRVVAVTRVAYRD
jgi:hypothetical protein